MKKYYSDPGTGCTITAAEAMQMHRNGKSVVIHYAPQHIRIIPGAKLPKKKDENRAHCKHIALELEAYADGNVYRCPECGEIHRLPDDVGDKYRCPDCETVNDLDNWDQLGIWDYFQDYLDIEYRVGSDRQYRSCRIMVACGGPNIYINTASKAVELYWCTEQAEYPISYDACDAVDEWAEEYWNI